MPSIPAMASCRRTPHSPKPAQQAGVVFVGPPPSAMRAMGSKSAAKTLMEKSGVPLLPGYHGDRQGAAFLADQANRIGYPLMIKAVSGGGGRGMRVVSHAGEFSSALDAARQEAASAFGDDRVLLERYLAHPRHIEVQVFADRHGNAVHLFERDCSVQRRHQKVIEEAPAPGLDDDRRAAMGARRRRRGAGCRLRRRRHGGVRRERGRILLPRDEHPSAGRAPGDRDDHRFRSRRMAIARGRGRAFAGRTGRDPHRRPCDRGAYIRRGPGARLRAFHRASGVVPHTRAVGGHPHRYRFRNRRWGFRPLRRHARQADLSRRHA